MSRSIVAALLSGLIFPGAGHLYLKHTGRGIALIAASAACLWVVVGRAMQQASAVLEKLELEGGVIDPGRIPELVAQTSNTPGSTLATIATLALLGCWIIGVVDAYRLGKKTGNRLH